MIEIDFFKEIYKRYKKNIKNSNKNIILYQLIRDSINLMVKDLIKNTIKNIKKKKIKSPHDVYLYKDKIVSFSNQFIDSEKEIKSFLRLNMYNNKNVLTKNNKGKKIIKTLFNIFKKNPKKYLNKKELKLNKDRAIADFISGMTDRYAINLYNDIK